MAPSNLPHNFFPTINLPTIIQKRSSSCEVSYSSQCSTHRTVLLIVSTFVAAFFIISFGLACIVKRARRRAHERAQASAKYPYRELRLLRHDSGSPVVARLPLTRPMGDTNLAAGVDQTWRKEGLWSERSAKRDEAPPPYTPRTPEPARTRI
ncbi:hypothetical protein COCC4DRAFT_36227 [Bipolaris maydis ATCC 48331]|uniref:Transmembrane protein n=2 Tax=Cochliobolus heterostrophus TaxID=5016 RepID=M2SX54_COCH5|nr:uncharacterized protein COCC4DRAFT_36227 [Bipolaris maydis ATCC 48331]EMD89935.1 hypothetical protein COCHEDRAFT_1156963 [Bipolaris maydis C5]KAH7563219.1 hypothetical protein BM1_00266 [Bipolaris maydis]ENI09853.1 hypothetical protein COCC4DRAFT_36227 [Bipolaris maydis ATCC 48331]KAJ5025379.1 hypothetical protein J3E73DRAFT_370896 [Bipolaris maydis]KAJ5063976.1 hypothetical protein J3E74DRAFT_308769 [Bipolaris maydis]